MEAINMPINRIQSVVDNAEQLYTLPEIYQAFDNMAVEITSKLKDTHPLVLCVMTGALIPAAHLIVRLGFPLEIDYLHVTRYKGTTRGGDLHWLMEPRIPLENRTILIVDDIMDGGLTLAAIVDFCKQAKAKEIYSAVMVSKDREREPGVDYEPDFVGLRTPDKYLFGFGLDYEEQLRNIPGIYAVNDK